MTGPLDGVDWSPLGLAENPVPGDPSGVRGLAGQLSGLADDAALQGRLLRAVGSSAEAVWEGPAAGVFHPKLAGVPGQLDVLVAAYRVAVDALEAYWPHLAAAQDQALEALSDARAAHAAISVAGAAVTSTQALAADAAGAYNQAATLPGGGEVALIAYRQSQSQLAGAQQALADARGQLSMAKAKAAAAKGAGSSAAAVLASALAAAPKPPVAPSAGWASSSGVHLIGPDGVVGSPQALSAREGRVALRDAAGGLERAVADTEVVLADMFDPARAVAVARQEAVADYIDPFRPAADVGPPSALSWARAVFSPALAIASALPSGPRSALVNVGSAIVGAVTTTACSAGSAAFDYASDGTGLMAAPAEATGCTAAGASAAGLFQQAAKPLQSSNSDAGADDHFTTPETYVNRHGQLTNGTYTIDQKGMGPHETGSFADGKSQWFSGVDAETSTLDAASYADENDLWVNNKAKVPVTSGHVGALGSDGTPTSWINVYRTNTGFVHGTPGDPP